MLQIGMPAMTDSGQLFLVSDATGHGDIYYVDIATSQPRSITFSESFEGSPVVADDRGTLRAQNAAVTAGRPLNLRLIEG